MSAWCIFGKRASRPPTAKVRSHPLYHVTVSKPYKQALLVGQEFVVGEMDNPFFSFYEGAREYAIIDNGNMVNVKAIRWLSLVREGQIAPHAGVLPAIALEVAQHYVMLSRELIMEDIRLNEFGGKPPSRQRCLYASDTLSEAKHWQSRLADPSSAICELSCTGTVLRADAALLLGDSEPLSETRKRARAYWRGESSLAPEWETLFVGKATVMRSGL